MHVWRLFVLWAVGVIGGVLCHEAWLKWNVSAIPPHSQVCFRDEGQLMLGQTLSTAIWTSTDWEHDRGALRYPILANVCTSSLPELIHVPQSMIYAHRNPLDQRVAYAQAMARLRAMGVEE